MTGYPKVLIIGQNFDHTGGGITLANLFKGWPKKDLAVASFEINKNELSMCDNYYSLGHLETKRPWPFYLLQREIYSGPVLARENIPDGILLTEMKLNKIREYLKNKYLAIQHMIGIYYIMGRFIASDKFIDWVNDLKPDVIYSQLSSLGFIRMVDTVAKQLKKPIIIHIMDDWPATLVKPGLFSSYWRKVVDWEFRRLLDNSVVLMSICKAMSDEYQIRYKKIFHPFHNPIDLSMWSGRSRKDWRVGNKMRMLYAGRLGDVNKESLIDICEAIADIRQKGFDLVFEIRTPELYRKNAEIFYKYKFVEINPYIVHTEIPNKLPSVDILIIPLDFNTRNIKFTQYSMPGKTSDYMASGTPILVYAPPQNALIAYAQEEKWGYIVDKRDKGCLVRAITQLITDIDMRERLGRKAIELAFKNHDANIVRREFQNLIINSIPKDY